MSNASGKLLLFQEMEYGTTWLQEVDKQQFNLSAPGGCKQSEDGIWAIVFQGGNVSGKELLISR